MRTSDTGEGRIEKKQMKAIEARETGMFILLLTVLVRRQGETQKSGVVLAEKQWHWPGRQEFAQTLQTRKEINARLCSYTKSFFSTKNQKTLNH